VGGSPLIVNQRGHFADGNITLYWKKKRRKGKTRGGGAELKNQKKWREKGKIANKENRKDNRRQSQGVEKIRSPKKSGEGGACGETKGGGQSYFPEPQGQLVIDSAY